MKGRNSGHDGALGLWRACITEPVSVKKNCDVPTGAQVSDQGPRDWGGVCEWEGSERRQERY